MELFSSANLMKFFKSLKRSFFIEIERNLS